MYGKKIRELREEKRWTQSELAKKIGTTQKNISKYELELLDLNTEILLKLSSVFSVSTDYILGQENEFGVVVQSDERNNLSELERQILAIVREYPKGFEDYALNAIKNGRDLAIYAQNKERNKARYQK